jgi:mono/diheme cytochrome c family protein
MQRLMDRSKATWLVATIAAASAVVGLTGCDLGPKANLDRGQQLFTQKCGSCHTLAGAGTSGDVGPNLDEALKNMSAQQISQSISDPNAVIAPGYQPNVMPQNFGQTLTPPQLQQLVAYLQSAVGSGSGGGGK